MSTNIGVSDIFYLLESNKLADVEEMKKVFHDHFLSTKDNWLVNGLFDYYLSTNSLRAVEVLASVLEPHDKHLLDRLTEALVKPAHHGQRVQTLTLLGHVARRQPTWLYKLANHTLFRELLKLLKMEAEMLSLMSALLLLVTLLPMLPAALGPYLHDIFEVFVRLASYHHHQSLHLSTSTSLTSVSCITTVDKDQLYLLHLRVGLHSLFHRLYAMYPQNFVAYLRQQYVQRDQLATFEHTVRPMLDSVRMHPLLVTASKDSETSAARWKKMEHHDIVAECGRFALDRSREEILMNVPSNPRFTPILDAAYICPPTGGSAALSTTAMNNTEEDSFWSPSMVMPPHSPPPHEPRSTPSTPNNNRSGTSPPEAAVEATPETTPVKDLRQLSARQTPVGSTAARALGAFGNGSLGGTSRPSTPTPLNSSAILASTGVGGGDSINDSHSILSQKIGRIVAERQNVIQHTQTATAHLDIDRKRVEIDPSLNGKNDPWPEDQEVLEIVSSQNSGKGEGTNYSERDHYNEDSMPGAFTDLSRKVRRLRFHSQCQSSGSYQTVHLTCKVRRAKSCPEMKVQKKGDCRLNCAKRTEETGTQTCDLVPYEHLLLGIQARRSQGTEHQTSRQNSDSRLSPTSMLDRYVEACTRTTTFTNDISKSKPAGVTKPKHRKKGSEDDGGDEGGDDDGSDGDYANQQLQLMQMQLQFERQRREVHAERNRRLLGKLRDSRALEEHNSALMDRLRMAEKEAEGLKSELNRSKREARLADEQYADSLRRWQSKCVEEQNQNRVLRDRLDTLELEVKAERKKVAISDRQRRSADAALFDAAHQLKGALKAASRGEELKHILETEQKRFLLLGEAQMKLQERTGGPMPMARQEAAQIQRAYADEITNLRRQLDSRTSLVEALRVRQVELETKDSKKEAILLEQQRLLLEAKERHEAELRALESKYKAQVEINLLLESRVLELHGTLEAATSGTHSAAMALASSASPKERSPPLSASLASSSEGSLAFIHSGTGIMMNDCCDPAGEIPNLQAIVEPAPSAATSSGRSNQRPTPKQD